MATIKDRFRGFLPVVVDVETGGFNNQTDALLEIAAVIIEMEEDGTFEVLPKKEVGGLRAKKEKLERLIQA